MDDARQNSSTGKLLAGPPSRRSPASGPPQQRAAGGVSARDECRWAAVVARDAAADGSFVYSVASTGVYCRPSCPSRAAKRENVRFHATPQDAEAAGFRPCKRCRPKEERPEAPLVSRIAEACRMIEAAEELPALAALAAAAGVSRFHFHRLFKSVTGVTPKAYAKAERQKRVRAALPHTRTVTEAIHESGYASSGRFYATSREVLGMTPSALRAGGAHEVIRFAVGACSLGSVLAAVTDKGICAILIGDDARALVESLASRFRRARLVGDDGRLSRTLADVVQLVEEPARGLSLPLDIRGTAFQHRVWDALRRIPPGETRTYAEIAALIGRPKAVRAVAGACAANAIAIAVPCHRVVRTGGALSGYRWGSRRKQALLEREKKERPG